MFLNHAPTQPQEFAADVLHGDVDAQDVMDDLVDSEPLARGLARAVGDCTFSGIYLKEG